VVDFASWLLQFSNDAIDDLHEAASKG
jgi:hypothetical protein